MSVGPDPAVDPGRFPIFVDETGRRRRWLRLTGWVVGVLAGAYISLFVVSLLSSPGLLPLSLPGVGRLLPNAAAPDIPVAGGGKQRPADVVTTGTPSPGPGAVLPSAAPTPLPTTRPTSSTSAQPTPSRTVGRTNAPSAAPTVTPSQRSSPSTRPTARGTGKPTARPTHTRAPHPANGRVATPISTP